TRRQVMRNMLAFLAAATLTLFAVGWYLDWFHLQSVPGNSGHRNVTIDINTRKIQQDLTEAEHKVEKKLAEKSSSTAQTTADPVKPMDAGKQTDPTRPLVGKALRKLGDVLDQPNR